MNLIIKLLNWFVASVRDDQEAVYTPEVPQQKIDEVEEERVDIFGPFDGPLEKIPKNRAEVYKVFGVPVKDWPKGKKSGLNKAEMTVARKLPGDWGSKRYCHVFFEPYLREALVRCSKAGVLEYIEILGCYNHRHIRNDPSRPLSYHSWGIAVDWEPRKNSPKYHHHQWERRIDSGYRKLNKDEPLHLAGRGPLPLPYSMRWMELYPEGVPYLIVKAFKSVGMTWGGDWGREKWMDLVEKYGVGYKLTKNVKATKMYKEAMKEWETLTFLDPMHAQLAG